MTGVKEILTPARTNDPRAYAKKLLLVAPPVAQMDTRGSLAHAVRINGVQIEIYGVVGEKICSPQNGFLRNTQNE